MGGYDGYLSAVIRAMVGSVSDHVRPPSQATMPAKWSACSGQNRALLDLIAEKRERFHPP